MDNKQIEESVGITTWEQYKENVKKRSKEDYELIIRIEKTSQLMADIIRSCGWRFGRLKDYTPLIEDLSEDLTKLGYQKIDNDKVVLSREEYEFLLKPSPSNPLTKVANEIINSFSNNKIKLVENVLNKVKEIGAIKALLEMKSMPKLFETIHNDIIKDIDELAKQLGVEIKE